MINASLEYFCVNTATGFFSVQMHTSFPLLLLEENHLATVTCACECNKHVTFTSQFTSLFFSAT